MNQSRNNNRLHRANRVRAKIAGTASVPRLRVFRSLTNFQVQAIDDMAGKTLVSGQLTELGAKTPNTVEGATKLGAAFAKKCKDANIEKVVFDRAGYKYHGKVKAFADAAREGGLIF